MVKFPEIDIKVEGDIDYYLTLDKQFVFATAVALTRVAQQAQSEDVPYELKREFTIRSDWWKKDRKFGIKIRAATKSKLVSQVHTAADWLVAHETPGGKTKTPHSRKRMGIPEGEGIDPVRAGVADPPKRSSKGIIAKRERPSRLLTGAEKAAGTKRKYKGRTFKLKFPSGTIWVAKRIRGILNVKWFMIPKVKVKEDKTIEPGVFHAVQKHFGRLFDKALTDAIKDAKRPGKTKTP